MKLIIGGLIGGAVGFGVYKFIGCSSGACPITGNPVVSMIYGALMGVLVGWQR